MFLSTGLLDYFFFHVLIENRRFRCAEIMEVCSKTHSPKQREWVYLKSLLCIRHPGPSVGTADTNKSLSKAYVAVLKSWEEQ